MPSLFGSGTSSLLGQQLGSLASLSSFGTPQRWDEGLSAGMLNPTQPQFGGIAKLSGASIGAGQQDPLTGSFSSGISKLKGADIGKFGMGAGVTPQTGRTGTTMGGAGNVGGDWAGVERWANEINAAAQATGVPVNLIKSIMQVESGGDPNAAGAPGVWGPMQVNSSPNAWGQGPWSYDPAANIMKGAEILAGNYRQYGSWDMAVQAYLGFGTDMYGTDNNEYRDAVMNNWNALNNATGGAGLGWTQTNTVPNVGSANGNRVLQEAVKYVGVQYVWGGIPGKGQDPWATGWDCSGFTYWLDQNYGGGALPMGSHYQYQYAQQTGQLNLNPGTLQPGDLVFFDTGWQGGAGAELNRAGHVGVYLGNDQFIHAANASQGTIVSQFSTYGGGQFIGGMRSAFSGGGAVSGGFGSTGGSSGVAPGGSGAYSILQRLRGY